MCGFDIADVAAELAIEQLGQPLWAADCAQAPSPQKSSIDTPMAFKPDREDHSNLSIGRPIRPSTRSKPAGPPGKRYGKRGYKQADDQDISISCVHAHATVCWKIFDWLMISKRHDLRSTAITSLSVYAVDSALCKSPPSRSSRLQRVLRNEPPAVPAVKRR